MNLNEGTSNVGSSIYTKERKKWYISTWSTYHITISCWEFCVNDCSHQGFFLTLLLAIRITRT
jgi:hypothetical protein